ncbi:MAG: patatin-like phospholipase family protein [Leptospirales bacterium]|nr:patatin-like phospholipase family protein [Leptospirales bacterium]
MALRYEKKKYRRALVLSGGGARGAYQVGVWKFLLSMGWKPDLVCGTSVGAINAVGIGCGQNLEELIQIWKTIERGKVYRVSLLTQIIQFFTRRSFTPVMDTAPLKAFLQERFNLPQLRKSDIEIVIAAVNILTSQLKFFNHRVIDLEHVMASSAIPILFPWQYIDGVPHWDGGVMMNTPILPALERGASEIIVVLLSPVGGGRLPLPRNRRQALERVFEQSLNGSYEAFMSHLAWNFKMGRGGVFRRLTRGFLNVDGLRVATVAPERMLGFGSIMNFSQRQADQLIHEGYTDAKNQLASFFGLSDDPY